MATPIDISNVDDWDEPLNSDPEFTSVHVFSTDDITVTFDGDTVGNIGAPLSVFDTSGANGTKLTKDGVTLYPIASEFGFNVGDFENADQKSLNGDYAEGWAGDLIVDGAQAGLVVSNAPTDTFKVPALYGTWLSGMGGNSVKASTEHYVVMQNILSDQAYPGDPNALYPLDDDLVAILEPYSQLDPALKTAVDALSAEAKTAGDINTDGVNDYYVEDLIDKLETQGAAGDVNGDGTIDIKDVLKPNETEIDRNIAVSTDYSVTLKDDGKLLYRWGNMIKKPNDVRIEATLDLPEEWSDLNATTGLRNLYSVTSAELVLHHTITNNPNDQVRPEDFENEAAIGTLPTYEIVVADPGDGNGARELWRTTDDYYAGDGTLYPAGTILKDAWLAEQWAGSDLAGLGASDGAAGYTNAWYTTMDREPFEPVLNGDGTDYASSGPRWRLQPDKYGQDLPGVVIPDDPSVTANPTKDQVKYEVGAETQTVLNLLDWGDPAKPLSVSAGWQDKPGEVSSNGLNYSEGFDLSVYIKGDIKPATIYSAELVMDYDPIEQYAAFASITGTAGDDNLVGVGNNTFTGGAGSDLFVVSYGASKSGAPLTANTITDFVVGEDALGLIGLGVTDANFDSVVSQTVTATGLDISIDRDGVGTTADPVLVATLTGVNQQLELEPDILLANPDPVASQTIGSVQEVAGLTGAAQTVSYQGGASFINPVVFASPVSLNGADPVTVEFSNVGTTGATLYLEEPEHYDGGHLPESVSLLTLEEGVWNLDDGSLLQVGTARTDYGPTATDTFYRVDFDTAFSETPYVLLQVQTNTGTDWEIARARNVTTTGFEFALQEEEGGDGLHLSEVVGWAAIDTAAVDGVFTWNGIDVQAFNTGATVDHAGERFVFDEEIGTDPLISGMISSYNGADPTVLRLAAEGNDGTAAWADFVAYEEESLDDEMWHIPEEVSGLAFEEEGLLTGIGLSVVDDLAIV